MTNDIKFHLLKADSMQSRALVARVEASAADKTAVLKKLGLLIQEKYDSVGIVHFAHKNTFKAIQMMSSIGSVFFEGRKLVVDLFSKAKLNFTAETVDEKIKWCASVQSNSQKFDLKDCDFIFGGPPHGYVKGISLCFIDGELPWETLKTAYGESDKLELSALKELAEDPENGVHLNYAGNAKETIEHQAQPTPVLILKDRYGGFADLWMDYKTDKIAFHEKMTGKIKRQFDAENAWEKDLLETDFVRKLMPQSHYYCPLDKVAKSLTFLLELGWQIIDFKGNRVMRQNDSQVEVCTDERSFVVKGKMYYGDHEANLTDVVGAFNKRERFVTLGSGIVGLLPQQWEQTGLSGIENGEIVAEGIIIAKNRLGTLGDLFAQPHVRTDEHTAKLKNFQGIAQVNPSEHFKGVLRPYQLDGLNWLAFLHDYGFNGILADDMGLGKTVQVIAFLSQLKVDRPMLIVMPTSLLFNWHKEIERFLPTAKVYRYHGPSRNAQEINKHNIILTSYTTLRMDLSLLNKIDFAGVILDEAQAIKNPASQIAGAVCGLKTSFRLSITGTPIENHLYELWSHLHFLMPDLLGTEQEFNSAVQAAGVDPRYLQQIKRKIRPFILRRTKQEVAKDLPERIDQTVWVEMEPAQRKIYDDYLAGIRGNLFKKVTVDGIAKHRMEVFEAILRLRQICCHPLLVSAQLEEGEVYDSAKLTALIDDIETTLEEGKKALVYSQFTTMLGLIGKELKLRGWNYAYLDGSTIDREGEVNRFQNDAETPLFLISLKAGGIGLNLTAADHVFLFDPWWNEAVENQAISRAHRIGRQDAVVAKRYVAAETIEEKIMKLKAAKRSLIDSVFDDEVGQLALTEDDFKFLME